MCDVSTENSDRIILCCYTILRVVETNNDADETNVRAYKFDKFYLW